MLILIYFTSVGTSQIVASSFFFSRVGKIKRRWWVMASCRHTPAKRTEKRVLSHRITVSRSRTRPHSINPAAGQGLEGRAISPSALHLLLFVSTLLNVLLQSDLTAHLACLSSSCFPPIFTCCKSPRFGHDGDLWGGSESRDTAIADYSLVGGGCV